MEILQRFNDIMANETLDSITVLEVGACDGYHSNLLIHAIKQQQKPYTYHLFEPVEDLLPQIVNNVKHHMMHNNGVIGIFPNAIGAENGEVTLYKSFGHKLENGHIVDHYYGSSSIRKPKLTLEEYPQMQFTEKTAVVVTLDSHLRSCGRHRDIIDFIWADVQGAEIDLLTGAREALQRTRYLYTEYGNVEYYEGQVGLDGLLALLPQFEVVEDYGSDILLRNKMF